MRDVGRLVHFLRNTPVRELMQALERTGLYYSVLLKQAVTSTGIQIEGPPAFITIAVAIPSTGKPSPVCSEQHAGPKKTCDGSGFSSICSWREPGDLGL